MKLRSSSSTGEVKQSGRNTHRIVPASADNTCAKSLLLSLVVGHHLDQYGNHELFAINSATFVLLEM